MDWNNQSTAVMAPREKDLSSQKRTEKLLSEIESEREREREKGVGK